MIKKYTQQRKKKESKLLCEIDRKWQRKKRVKIKNKQISHTQLVGQEKMSFVFEWYDFGVYMCVESRFIGNTNKSRPNDIAV